MECGVKWCEVVCVCVVCVRGCVCVLCVGVYVCVCVHCNGCIYAKSYIN